MRLLFALALSATVAACGGAPVRTAPSATPTSASVAFASASPTTAPSATPRATPSPTPAPKPIAEILTQIDPAKLDAHLAALTSFSSRWVTHPGHAKAQAYIKSELAKLDVKVESWKNVYQGMTLDNIFAFIDPAASAVGSTGWTLVSAHYDSTANRTPGWRPSIDPAPGADDNAT
ncbi:MAG: hypothetical protein E6J49_12185, partial [Chloroflexi bacterium]